MVRSYKLNWTASTTTSAAATLQFPTKGTLLGCSWAVGATGGAGVDGRLQFELSTASVTTATTNDTPGNTLSNCALANNVASSASAVVLAHPIGTAINPGDKLYIHVQASGTAYGSVQGTCTVFVSQ